MARDERVTVGAAPIRGGAARLRSSAGRPAPVTSDEDSPRLRAGDSAPEVRGGAAKGNRFPERIEALEQQIEEATTFAEEASKAFEVLAGRIGALESKNDLLLKKLAVHGISLEEIEPADMPPDTQPPGPEPPPSSPSGRVVTSTEPS